MHLRKDSPLLPQSQCSVPEYLCWGLTVTETAETQTFQCWAKKWGTFSSKQKLRKTQLSKVAGQQQFWNIHPRGMAQHASPQNYCHGSSRGFWRKEQRILYCPYRPQGLQRSSILLASPAFSTGQPIISINFIAKCHCQQNSRASCHPCPSPCERQV